MKYNILFLILLSMAGLTIAGFVSNPIYFDCNPSCTIATPTPIIIRESGGDSWYPTPTITASIPKTLFTKLIDTIGNYAIIIFGLLTIVMFLIWDREEKNERKIQGEQYETDEISLK